MRKTSNMDLRVQMDGGEGKVLILNGTSLQGGPYTSREDELCRVVSRHSTFHFSVYTESMSLYGLSDIKFGEVYFSINPEVLLPMFSHRIVMVRVQDYLEENYEKGVTSAQLREVIIKIFSEYGSIKNVQVLEDSKKGQVESLRSHYLAITLS